MWIRTMFIGVFCCVLLIGCTGCESEWYLPEYRRNTEPNDAKTTVEIAGELALAKERTIVVANNNRIGIVTSGSNATSETIYTVWSFPSSVEEYSSQKDLAKWVKYTVPPGSEEYDHLSGLFVAGMDASEKHKNSE